ncbi:MAG: PilC/PilY family type IV pilus protein [candidate division WOR-3 bacterium]|nr:PilC/PilY family type IV pilus protein [candidate division WOR-3 bacterium]
MRRFFFLLLAMVLSIGYAQIDTAYCCSPVFMWKVPTPNILIILDNSGSMAERGYTTTEIIRNSPADTIRYYGYFNPDSFYVWDNNRFRSAPNGPYPGRILNWACMSRGDIAKKVLIGGKGPSTWGAASDPVRIQSEGRYSWTVYYRSNINPTANYNAIIVEHSGAPGPTTVRITRVGNGPLPSLESPSGGGVSVEVDIPRRTWGGILRQIADKNDDGRWDDMVPRFGLAVFNYGQDGNWGGYNEGGGSFANNGGHIEGGAYIGDVSYTDMYQAIRNVQFTTWTPLGEVTYEMVRYFSQAPPAYANANYTPNPVSEKDPFYDKTLPGPAGWGKMTPCRKSFILMITDGEPTMDLHIPGYSVADTLPNAVNLRSYAAYPGSGVPAGPGSYPQNGSNYLIHIAYYANINDLRPDTAIPMGHPLYNVWKNRHLPDVQNVVFYGIAAFESYNVLEQACKFGGFVDKNGNKRPDLQSEWDVNNDGIPDNYFVAEDGYKLEQAILKAIKSMMSRVASASPVAVVATGTQLGGLVTQSQFYQTRFFPTGEQVDWLGTTHTLWLDPRGNLREDNQKDAVLHMINDYVIKMRSTATGVTVVRYRDSNGDGYVSPSDSIGAVPIEELVPVWDGGKWLYTSSPDARNIKVFVDFNNNNRVDGGELLNFTPGLATTLRPYLKVNSVAAADTVIRYIRGSDIDTSKLRPRVVQGMTWKLGDIVNSGPVLVGAPVERYDFIYGDRSYFNYYNQYKDRHKVVYVGANDGMLHAFNAGKTIDLDNNLTPFRLDPGTGYTLGQELWAYIPYNLLPHLKYLKEKNYYFCHVNYVDLRVYVTDAKIFDSTDAKYPGGWGTVLIGGMRLGGLDAAIPGDTCRSAYFMIDVTDPFNPIPMWEYTADDLDLTVCYSTVVKVKEKWYLVFGSGPVNCPGDGAQRARVFVLDLKSGMLMRKITLAENNSFITNIFGCDWGLDYTVDRLYFGICYGTHPNWYGKIYRIKTNDNPDPATWDTATVMNLGLNLPVTAEGSVATDEYNHLWVYFGTGRLFNEFDMADTTIPKLYIGFRDDTTHTLDPFQLFNATNVWIDTLGRARMGAQTITFDSLITLVNNRKGWYRWFSKPGERNLNPTLVIGGAVLFTTFRPSAAVCSYGGEGRLYALYYKTGTAYKDPFLGEVGDTNRVFISLGPGMPSEPSLYVTADQTKVFIQVGGGIVSPETGIPGLPRSGVILWKGR